MRGLGEGRVGRRGPLRVGLALLVAVVASLAAPLTALGADDLLPDLRMARPSDIHLCARPTQTEACPVPVEAGPRLLRFSTIMSDVGDGPFEVHGTRECPTCEFMTTRQFIKRSDGTWRSIATRARQKYSTLQHHNHWHVQRMERYALYGLAAALPGDTPVGHKFGYCFFDGLGLHLGLPNAASSPHYSYFSCGTPTSQSTVVGLSVGWGDIYPWDFGGQYINVTDVPDGDYLLCVTADPFRFFREKRIGNDDAWAKLTITGGSITVGDMGGTPCQGQLPYAIPAR